jgi:hypothetical protein
MYGDNVPDKALMELCEALPVSRLGFDLRTVNLTRQCRCFVESEPVRALPAEARLELAGAWHQVRRKEGSFPIASPALFAGFQTEATFAVTAQWSKCLPPPKDGG